jgi:hypothetical protein
MKQSDEDLLVGIATVCLGIALIATTSGVAFQVGLVVGVALLYLRQRGRTVPEAQREREIRRSLWAMGALFVLALIGVPLWHDTADRIWLAAIASFALGTVIYRMWRHKVGPWS